jgi:hypothetical protein
VNVAFVIVVGSIAALKVALTVVSIGTVTATLAGFSTVIAGPATLVAIPVVKFQVKFATKATPVRSLAAVVIVAVYCVLAARLAVGVKIAILPAEETVPGTAAPPTVAATVNVPTEEIVDGSIEVLNVAATF